MMKRIPIYQPSIGIEEKENVNKCLDSTWISSKGEFIEKFEREFSKKFNCTYSTTVTNGTVALHLALLALGVKEGDEVIVPTLTYVASVNAILYVGATPVFVDCDKDTWQLSIEEVEKKITPKTKAILAVHLYGQPADMLSLMKIAEEKDVYVIEDCAEAIGSKIDGEFVGNFGHVSTFSFFGNKTMTTGEGGMVCSNIKSIIDRVARLKTQGLASHREYWHDIVGYNYRMTNICAAIGLAQLNKVDGFIRKKQDIAKKYKQCLANLPLGFQGESDNTTHTHWMFSILVDDVSKRDELRAFLNESGIETRPVFYSIHSMPTYNKYFGFFKNSDEISSRGINLPSYPDLTDEDIDYISDKIREYFSK
ncbi:DegT/DnrJ/EryC1/StrS family aminotransferase [Vibrio furnissii]|uniref:DegT/DnrJ/EryC1/StrS family aminotransferase n=1 Tax=Vibrio furnissii TaxID=29494 RepID=UPI002410FF64|nr:DegT/DnrJ/EryC1/StrS family aminotransferase [Vibrio furnissii]